MSRKRTTKERGYGADHERLRRWWAPRVESGSVACSRCGRLIGAGARWHLDHRDDRLGYRGPSHVLCNLRAAAAKTNRIRRAKTARRAPDRVRGQSERWL